MALKFVGRLLAAVLVAASLASLIGAVSEHETERARWDRERQAVGTDRYDAQASDQSYARSRDAWALAGMSAMALVIGAWWIFAVADPSGARSSTKPPTTLRRNGAAIFDLGLATAIVALSLLDDGESAVLRALTCSAPLVALATHAVPLQVLGTTMGMRLVGVRAGGVGPGRALLASILLPLAIVGFVRPAWSAPHWRLGGVAPSGDAE